ncbi:MAG TPA: hypothetical protein PK252_12310 [Bacteroidales bacterium]|nr:hypothetical protein [Bacteroidales bacterium]
MKLLFIYSFLFIFFCNAHAQLTGMGQDPSSVKWRQIQTKRFRLVYDTCYENQAQKVAAIMDYSLSISGNTINQNISNTPILLHNHNAISNGFVTVMPNRMEFYTAPPQDMPAIGWFEMLGIHEGRHQGQMLKMNTSYLGYSKYLFGEGLWGLNAALQAPSWFYEGDAVAAETALTNSGRGRLPSFVMATRARLIGTHRPFHFRKAWHGSYKDYVPNQYEFGYLMVAYNRIKYGTGLWETVLQEIADSPFPGITAPFLDAVKNKTSKNRRQLYNETYKALDSIWTAESHHLSLTSFDKITQKPFSYTNYTSPVVAEGKLVVYRRGLSYTPAVVSIDKNTGEEKKLFEPGYILSEKISAWRNWIYWDEYRPDIRWANRSYSVIMAYNMATGKKIQLTQKSRYYAPAVSPDGEKLIVVENDVKGMNSLVILDANTGEKLRSFTFGQKAVQSPCWSPDGSSIAYTMVADNAKGLYCVDIQSGKVDTLILPGFHQVEKPFWSENTIYFSASYSGIDNIYAFNVNNKKVYQVTSALNGAFDACVSQDTLIYANYTMNGMEIVQSVIDTVKWTEKKVVDTYQMALADKLSAQEPQKYNPDSVRYIRYDSRPYRKIGHLFHIHSWVPLYANSSATTLDRLLMPGYTVANQNLLNTFVFTGGQGFWQGKLYSSLHVTWQGWFPVFQAGLDYGDSVKMYGLSSDYRSSASKFIVYTNVSIPLSTVNGQYGFSLAPGATYSYDNRLYSARNGVIFKGAHNSVFSVNASVTKNSAARDLFPMLGVKTEFIYVQPISPSNVFSPQQVGSVKVFLPGLYYHHSLRISVAYEEQQLNNYFQPDRLPAPRGYEILWDTATPSFTTMKRWAIDYSLPLVYPDINILKVFYLKRIWFTGFHENSQAKVYKNKAWQSRNYVSNGGELYFDFRAFSLPPTLRIGYRLSFVPSEKRSEAMIVWGYIADF